LTIVKDPLNIILGGSSSYWERSTLKITVHVKEKTPEACRKYNEFYHAGEKVILLAHGTC